MAKFLINIPAFRTIGEGQQEVSNERVELDLDQHPRLLKHGERYLRKHGRPSVVGDWRRMPRQTRIAVIVALMKEPVDAPPLRFTPGPRHSIPASALTAALLRNQR